MKISVFSLFSLFIFTKNTGARWKEKRHAAYLWREKWEDVQILKYYKYGFEGDEIFII